MLKSKELRKNLELNKGRWINKVKEGKVFRVKRKKAIGYIIKHEEEEDEDKKHS